MDCGRMTTDIPEKDLHQGDHRPRHHCGYHFACRMKYCNTFGEVQPLFDWKRGAALSDFNSNSVDPVADSKDTSLTYPRLAPWTDE